MEVLSRGDLKQLVRQVRAGTPWERVRVSVPNVNPAWLDSEWKGWVLSTAGFSPASAVETPVPVKRKRRKG